MPCVRRHPREDKAGCEAKQTDGAEGGDEIARDDLRRLMKQQGHLDAERADRDTAADRELHDDADHRRGPAHLRLLDVGIDKRVHRGELKRAQEPAHEQHAQHDQQGRDGREQRAARHRDSGEH